jgi:ATP-dependent Clp endopeptidase proteolytic subunit ClpP
MKTEFLTIENRKGFLKLNSGVYKESADKLIEELETLYGPAAVATGLKIGEIVCAADDALEVVTVEINSPGGSVFDGYRIYNALRGISSRGVIVRTVANGIAASMGSVILMAGDERVMTAGSRIMIHDAATVVSGNAATIRKTADTLESISDEIAGIYASRAGISKDVARAMMLEETWMDSKTAEKLGFVTEITAEKENIDNLTDSNQISVMSILSKLIPSAKAEEIAAAEAKIESIQADFDAATKALVEAKDEIASLTESVATHAATIAAKDEKITELDAAVANARELIASITAEAEEAKDSAGKQAAAMLASIGQEKPLPDVAATLSIEEQYKRIEDPAKRSEFRRKNWDKLSK